MKKKQSSKPIKKKWASNRACEKFESVAHVARAQGATHTAPTRSTHPFRTFLAESLVEEKGAIISGTSHFEKVTVIGVGGEGGLDQTSHSHHIHLTHSYY